MFYLYVKYNGANVVFLGRRLTHSWFWSMMRWWKMQCFSLGRNSQEWIWKHEWMKSVLLRKIKRDNPYGCLWSLVLTDTFIADLLVLFACLFICTFVFNWSLFSYSFFVLHPNSPFVLIEVFSLLKTIFIFFLVFFLFVCF